MSEACRLSLDDLRLNQYELIGPGGDLILPRFWEALIQPGWTVSIQLLGTVQQPTAEHHTSSHQNPSHTLEEQMAREEERMLRWERERQGEHQRWQSERLAERLRWEAERQREWEHWIEDRRALADNFATNRRRCGKRVNQRSLCNISPCLCWLSGKRQICR